jgi:hypothetical protein
MHGAEPVPAAVKRPKINAQAAVSAALVVFVGIGTLLTEASGWTGLRPATHVGVLLWFALNLHRLRGVEIVFMAAAVGVVPLVLAFAEQPWPVLAEALDRAGLFLTFVSSLNLLRDAAQSSVAVRRAGLYLISQSPPRRYAALTMGCHLFTIALNMGALVLLGAMVRRSNTLAAAGGDAVVVAIRERRMTTALLRGFGTTLMWTPTGVSVGYTLSLVPAVTWFDVAPLLFGLAMTWLALGWAIDRLQWPPSARRAALPPPPHVSPLEAVPMLCITALLLLSVIAAKLAMGSSLLVATLSTVPFVAVIWLALQYRRFGARAAVAVTARRLRRHVLFLLPQTRPESVVLAAAGFAGVGFSALVQAGGVSAWLSQLALPPAAIAIGVFLLIIGLAQVAITPLVIATIVGTTVTHMTPMPIPPLALAMAIQAGWSLASAASPYTGGMLTLARVVDKRPAILLRWNAVWGLVCAAVVAVFYLVWLS